MNDNTNITQKELREHLYKCRDFEIKHLWQRSVFLWTFLGFTYTAYGFVFKKIIEKTSDTEILHFAAIILGTLGVLLSLLWIMMGKGSKYWYEVYLHKISLIEDDLSLGIHPDFKSISTNIPEDKINKCIFSCKAARYSPSQINIALGQISLCVWIVILFVHFFILFNDVCQCKITLLKLLLLCCAIGCPFILVYSKWVKISSLGKQNQK
jgi:hypothetical protein